MRDGDEDVGCFAQDWTHGPEEGGEIRFARCWHCGSKSSFRRYENEMVVKRSAHYYMKEIGTSGMSSVGRRIVGIVKDQSMSQSRGHQVNGN